MADLERKARDRVPRYADSSSDRATAQNGASVFACRPQVQERLTQQVADWLHGQLKPAGTGVVVVAEHLCMTLRGARAGGARTVTSALHGLLLHDPRARGEFFALSGITP